MLRACRPNLVRVLCVTMAPDGGHMLDAMEKLGFTPYNLKSALNNVTTDAVEWSNVYTGKSRVNPNFFNRTDCLVGPPAAIVFDKIFEACPPYTKVILVEEPNKEQWAADVENFLPPAVAAAETLKGHSRVATEMITIVKGMMGEPLSPQAGGYAGALEEFELKVKSTIPSNRLLVWRYGEGYEPLAQFLGVPVPTEPFPSYYNGFDFLQRLTERLNKARGMSRVMGAMIVIILVVMLWPLLKKSGTVMEEVYRDYQVAFSGAEADGRDVNNTRDAMILAKNVTVSFEEKWRNKGALAVTTRTLEEGNSK